VSCLSSVSPCLRERKVVAAEGHVLLKGVYPTAYPPTTRYSIPFESSNCKNSLKSFGNSITTKHHLSQELNRFKPFLWTIMKPMVKITSLGQGDDFEHISLNSFFNHNRPEDLLYCYHPLIANRSLLHERHLAILCAAHRETFPFHHEIQL